MGSPSTKDVVAVSTGTLVPGISKALGPFILVKFVITVFDSILLAFKVN